VDWGSQLLVMLAVMEGEMAWKLSKERLVLLARRILARQVIPPAWGRSAPEIKVVSAVAMAEAGRWRASHLHLWRRLGSAAEHLSERTVLSAPGPGSKQFHPELTSRYRIVPFLKHSGSLL